MDPSVRGFDGQVNVSFRVRPVSVVIELSEVPLSTQPQQTPISVPGTQRLYKAAIENVFGIPASADLSKRDGRVSASTCVSRFQGKFTS